MMRTLLTVATAEGKRCVEVPEGFNINLSLDKDIKVVQSTGLDSVHFWTPGEALIRVDSIISATLHKEAIIDYSSPRL